MVYFNPYSFRYTSPVPYRRVHGEQQSRSTYVSPSIRHSIGIRVPVYNPFAELYVNGGHLYANAGLLDNNDNTAPEEAALERANRVYSNYAEAVDNPINPIQQGVFNTLKFLQDNVWEGIPAGVSNCTLTASQWVDPNIPIKNASSIVNNPSSYNYTQVDESDAVPGNLVIAKVPDKDSYHTMMISGFAPKDGIYNFNGTLFPYKKGEPLVTYSRGGHDNSFIQRNIPLSVYTANSDGHTENRYYRYNYPNEVFLPNVTVKYNK